VSVDQRLFALALLSLVDRYRFKPSDTILAESDYLFPHDRQWRLRDPIKAFTNLRSKPRTSCF
jgi:hypothetical protein